jgi:hypothetical protein
VERAGQRRRYKADVLACGRFGRRGFLGRRGFFSRSCFFGRRGLFSRRLWRRRRGRASRNQQQDHEK